MNYLLRFIDIHNQSREKQSGLKMSILAGIKVSRRALLLILILFVSFFSWYFSFSYIVGSFRKVFSSVLYGAGESFFTSQVTAFSSYSPKIFDILRVIVFNYGILFIIGISSIFSLHMAAIPSTRR